MQSVLISSSSLASIGLSLTMILAMLAVVAFFGKKLKWKELRHHCREASEIRVLAARSIGWNSSIFIVETGDDRFLVSSGRGGISTIGVLSSRAKTSSFESA